MNKRARTSDQKAPHWLNLGQALPRDLRKLFYSRLSADDMYMIRSAHGLASPPSPGPGHARSGRQGRYRIPRGFHERCAERGYWDILKYTIVKHDPSTLSRRILVELVKTGQLPLVQWFLCAAHHHHSMENVGETALILGKLNVLQWAIELGYQVDGGALWQAMTCGNLDLLELLFVTKGYPWNGEYIEAAIRHGHEHVIQWVDKHGFDYSSHYIRTAEGTLQSVRISDSENESDE